MTDELAKTEKRVRGAQKASATKIMQQVSEIVRSTESSKTITCLRLALKDEFETIKALDVEVIDRIDDNRVVDDIERADELFSAPCWLFTALLRISSRLLLQ